MVKLDLKIFFFSLIALYMTFYLLPLHPAEFVMARLTQQLLSYSGIESSLVGNQIITIYGNFEITKDCLGIISISTFVSLLLATRNVPRFEKILFILISIPVFLFWNLARIVISLVIGKQEFESFHFSLWMVSVLIIISLYYLCIKIASMRNQDS